MVALNPALASSSTTSILSCFSGSSRMKPSFDAITAHSVETFSVAPEGRVSRRSAGGVCASTTSDNAMSATNTATVQLYRLRGIETLRPSR
jgi:hypothetical protein